MKLHAVLIPLGFLLLGSLDQGSSQLVKIFEDNFQIGVTSEHKSDCKRFSGFGQCVWIYKPNRKSSQTYKKAKFVAQQNPGCRSHWFFKFMKTNYAKAIDNVFTYLTSMTEENQPCGQCSYKSRCGKGGSAKCHKNPIIAQRSVQSPLYVEDKLCDASDGIEQRKPCTCKASLLRTNLDPSTGVVGKKTFTCQIWPNHRIQLPGISRNLTIALNRVKWSNCAPVGPKRNPTSCKCCCDPYKPKRKRVRGKRTWLCVKPNKRRTRKNGRN